MTLDYIFKITVRSVKDFPILEVFPKFYQEVMIAFNKVKHIKPFHLLNNHELIQQPLWGNEYFKIGETHLYLKEWLKKSIYYVKDLINEAGNIKSDNELYRITNNHKNIVTEMYILKNYIMKKIRKFDVSIGPYVKIRGISHIVHKNKLVNIRECKSRDYYAILISKKESKGHMESIYSRMFNISDSAAWQRVYSQKLTGLRIPKLAEFNFKLLQNIVPNGNVICKWQKDISKFCEYCGDVETSEHMLFSCPRIQHIWNKVSALLKVKVTWKHLVCGYPSYDMSSKIITFNYIFTIVMYAILKENSACKFNKRKYSNSNIISIVQANLAYYNSILEKVEKHVQKSNIMLEVCEKLCINDNVLSLP